MLRWNDCDGNRPSISTRLWATGFWFPTCTMAGLAGFHSRQAATIVQIRSDEIAIHAFTPSDGSESAAIKVIHRPSGKEAVNDTTESQLTNLRKAVGDLVASMNPHPDQISAPELVLFDRVRVNLPQSIHDGEINDMTWDYTRSEWKFFVECSEHKVSNWYVLADLNLRED